MVKHSRRYSAAAQEVDRDRFYQPEEAIDRLKELSTAKFDETVEIHLRTNADPRHADQMVRGVAVLPHGLGKTVRVLVFAGADSAEAARQAGADFVGEDELIEQIEGGWTDFDLGLAVPAVMPKIGKLGRILGRKGLMPNPRSGTMVQPQDLPRVIQEAKGGRVEYRTDRTAIIHSSVGKISFGTEQLVENMASLTSAIFREKPGAVKGAFLRSAYLTSSMGPSVPLDVPGLQSLEAPE
ncbi:MAG: 50S ribosomal protein L1 [SAR202 cluster bacterium Io17-Chloro-G9]|nr:MAG: 50S ribosomal protein L1 [SAR202 cluster bacterium Io17-Chloro-G9]